jgi:hypothetical protein
MKNKNILHVNFMSVISMLATVFGVCFTFAAIFPTFQNIYLHSRIIELNCLSDTSDECLSLFRPLNGNAMAAFIFAWLGLISSICNLRKKSITGWQYKTAIVGLFANISMLVYLW